MFGAFRAEACYTENMKTTFDFTGQQVLVTGGSRGIGYGISRAFASAGARVAISARNEKALRQAATAIEEDFGTECIPILMDVADPESVQTGFDRFQDRFGAPDILINNAGTANSLDFADMSEDAWDRVMNTNLKGVYSCCRAGLKIMERGAAIVNIASISGSSVNFPQYQANYNTSKAGVIMLSKSLAVEYASRGIRINSVSPGYTMTEMNQRKEVADLIALWTERTPFKRLAEIGEITGPVLFLASDASSFITGHDLVVDGGITLLC